MKRALLVLTTLLILAFLVSCDGEILREVVDAKEISSITVLDYIGGTKEYRLTNKGIEDKDGTLILTNNGISSVSLLDSGKMLVLYTDGTLKTFKPSDKTFETNSVSNVAVLTHSGFWIENKNNKSVIHYKNTTTTTDTFFNAYESNGRLFVSYDAGDNLLVNIYDDSLELISSKFMDIVVYGYIHVSSPTDLKSTYTDFILGYSTIYNLDGKALFSYTNTGSQNHAFGFYKGNDLFIAVEGSSSYSYKSTSKDESGSFLTDIGDFFVMECAQKGNKVYITTQNNGVYEVDLSTGTPVVKELD